MIKVTHINKELTKSMLQEYFLQVLSNERLYNYYYSTTKNVIPKAFKLIEQEEFASSILCKRYPISFDFFQYLMKEYPKYLNYNIYRMKMKTKEDALKLIKEHPTRDIKNQVFNILERPQMEKFFKTFKYSTVNNNFNLINLALFGLFLTPKEVGDLTSFMFKHKLLHKINSGFFTFLTNEIKEHPIFKGYNFENISNYFHACKKELEKYDPEILNYFFDRDNTYPAYFNISKENFYSTNSMPKLKYEEDKKYFALGIKDIDRYSEEYPYSQMYEYLENNDEKEKFIIDFISKIKYSDWGTNIGDLIEFVFRELYYLFKYFDDKEKFFNILIDNLFDKKIDLAIDICRHDERFLYLMILFDSNLQKLRDLNILEKLLLKFKNVYYLFCKIYPDDPLSLKRKNKQYCFGNVYEAGCDECIFSPQKNLNGLIKCEKEFEPISIEKNLESDDKYYNYKKLVKQVFSL